MRKLLATALLALAVAGCHQAPTYNQVCHTPTEDSAITCHLDPTARYDYIGGVGWVHVPDTMRYANVNQPPTGQQLNREHSS